MSVVALKPRASISRLAAVLLALCLPFTAVAQDESPVQTQSLAIWRLLDYMAVDYREAVREGAVINADEYAEMTEFAQQVQARLQGLPPREGRVDLLRQAEALIAAVANKAPDAEVAPAANRLAQALLEIYPAPTTPRAAPDVAAAAALYETQCAACHGATGHGDGPLAAGMEPPPVDFHDPVRQRQRSVFALHGIITNGVDGTAMGGYRHLDDAQRWALAFHVGQLLYTDVQREEGSRIWASSPVARAAIPDLRTLVGLTPAALAAQLGRDEADAVMGYLRQAPDVLAPPPDDALSRAREAVRAAAMAYAAGEARAARDAALAAYLDGFELVEPALAARAPDLVRTIERAMMEFRASVERPGRAPEVEAQALALDGLLQKAADELGGQQMSAGGAFASSFVILFREGLEAMLVLVAMIAFLRKSGRSDALRYVHVGWASALVLGLLTWVAATYLIRISGAQRELTEAFTALLAVIILVFVGLWLHNQSLSGRWQQYIKERIRAELSRNRLWGLALLAFVAVYREAFETVLFYRALWEQGAHGPLLAGLLSAAVVLAGVAWALFKASVRLPITQFFGASAWLIAALAVVLAGKAIRAFQEAGSVAMTGLPLPTLDWVGFYPSLETVLAQATVLAIVLGGAVWNVRRQPLIPAPAGQK